MIKKIDDPLFNLGEWTGDPSKDTFAVTMGDKEFYRCTMDEIPRLIQMYVEALELWHKECDRQRSSDDDED